MPSQSRSYLKLGLVVLFLILLVLLSSLILPRKAPILKASDLIKALNLASTFEFVFRSEGLSKIVADNLQGKEGEYAVYIEELPATPSATAHLGGENQKDSQLHLPGENAKDDPEIYTLRSSDSFPAASLYKVYLMAAVLKEVEPSVILGSEATPESDSGQARMTLDTKLTASKAHLIEVFGGVDFGYEDRGETIEYTVEEALTRIGRISDNFAAIMLMDKVGPEKVQEVANSLNSPNTLIRSPVTTSASDMGKFFKALYKGEVVNKNVSDKIIEFLALNQLNNRIPALLPPPESPEHPEIIHKTGELPGIRHDAGIVIIPESLEHPEKAYVIVLMSQNLKYEDEGVETLAKISKEVFEYFRAKK